MGPGLFHPCDPPCRGAMAAHHRLQTHRGAEQASSRRAPGELPASSVPLPHGEHVVPLQPVSRAVLAAGHGSSLLGRLASATTVLLPAGQHWERSLAWLEWFRAWEQLPGCKYPFPALKLPQTSLLLLRAAGARGPGICGDGAGASWSCPCPADSQQGEGPDFLFLAHEDHLYIEQPDNEAAGRRFPGVAPSGAGCCVLTARGCARGPSAAVSRLPSPRALPELLGTGSGWSPARQR